MTFRFARPTSNLKRARTMSTQGLDWEILGSFEDHGGFDGVMMGHRDESHHFEFVMDRNAPISPQPTVEDLWVIYLPSPSSWRARCEAMEEAGFMEVTAHNPYWRERGRTFVDFDGDRTVIQNDLWTPTEARA